MCGTFHFLGLQAVCPLLVLLKVGGGSTPVERDEAFLLCLSAGPPSPIIALSLQAGFLGQRDAQRPTPPGSCSNPFWMVLPGQGATPAPSDAFVVQLPVILEGEVAGLPSDGEHCRNNTLPNNSPCAPLPKHLPSGAVWKKDRSTKRLCLQPLPA